MAKKKDVEEKQQKNEIEDSIIKSFGDCIKSISYVKQLRTQIINTTPKLDLILGGGIPTGSFVVLTGPPKHGKSSLALQIAANAQKVSNSVVSNNWGERCVYYFDIEGRIKERDLNGIKGLDLSENRFKLIQSSPGNILWGDQFIDIAEKLINAIPGAIFILDSFSALCTKSRAEADIKDRFRDDAPLLLGSFCKRIAQVIPINQSILIGITHLIANQGGMSHSPWMEASGRKIQYQADVKLKGTHFKMWKTGENIIGQEVFWDCQTSAIGPPGGSTNTWLRFGEGFDSIKEIIEVATELGVIKKSGTWLEYDGNKLQGDEKMRQFLIDNPDKFTLISEQIASIFKK